MVAQAGPAFAIAGTVHDTNGAVIAHAQVLAQLEGTATTITGESGDDGTFRLAVAAAGSYRVVVTAEGFKGLDKETALTAAAPAAEMDLGLEIAATAETVEVTADALAAETTSTQLGETLGTKKMENVPLNGRSFTDLMAVQPGIVPQNTAQPGAVMMTGVARRRRRETRTREPVNQRTARGIEWVPGERRGRGRRREHGDVDGAESGLDRQLPGADVELRRGVWELERRAGAGDDQGRRGTGARAAFEFLRNTALDARNYFLRSARRTGRTNSAARWAATPWHKSVRFLATTRARG